MKDRSPSDRVPQRKRQRGIREYSVVIDTTLGTAWVALCRSRRRRRRLWFVSLVLVSWILCTDAAQSPSTAKNEDSSQRNSGNSNNVPPNRINSPNRRKTDTTGHQQQQQQGSPSSLTTTATSTASTTSMSSSISSSNNALPTLPKPTARYPTPQDHKHRPSSTATGKSSVVVAAADSTFPTTTTQHLRAHTSQVELDFFDWCTDVLGIETILEIETFEYYNYMKVMPKEDWNDDDDDDDGDDGDCVEDFPMIPVRGLAASRDIAKGEVVIRIPLGALLSVATTIDKDPILTQVMGPDARQANGWTAAATDDTSVLLEVPLLAVALLYHASLGPKSHLYPYIQILQLSEGLDAMPFLWSSARLRAEASEGVRMVARGIQRDMNEMYDAVVPVLVEQYPDIFARHDSEEWVYSREKFQWAFAMITTRHWQLPIEDLRASKPVSRHRSRGGPPESKSATNYFEDSTEEAGLPPASTPTDHWVEEQGVEETDDDGLSIHQHTTTSSAEKVLVNHSFLAPFADLLNFGPPCTRGRYDSETHSFEITALCDFKKGQEVTFYYSDECDHVVRERLKRPCR